MAIVPIHACMIYKHAYFAGLIIIIMVHVSAVKTVKLDPLKVSCYMVGSKSAKPHDYIKLSGDIYTIA